MTVFVDDAQIPAQVGRIRSRWSHLMADTTDELLTFALDLGMRRTWIQHPGTPLEHFDLTETKRLAALRRGAVPIRYGREGAALTRAKREGRPFDVWAWRREQAARS